ncbi:MAG: hypothetical protein L0229_11645 [Blastocatellia bacterium]|nr:hypothetical protein [Blastocatellia bacterium]
MSDQTVNDQARRYSSQTGGRHAVVIGASMAGLLAARVLGDHFERVTLIERDAFPASAANRKGVPQGRHLHALLVKGEQIISKLFPGLTSDLTEGGAIRFDLPGDVLWHHFGGYKIRFYSGMTIISMSRPFLESQVRSRVLALDNLTCLEQCDVDSLLADRDRTRITGVRVHKRSEGSQEEALDADLVVDATGRGSRSPGWLEALGYSAPEESVVKVGIGYTTRIFRQNPDSLPGAKAIFTMPVPPHGKRGGALFPIEGGRWIVTLAGWLGDHAPAEEQGFLDFAESLASRDIYNAIARAEPLSDFVTHKFPSNLRHHYERMNRFPEGYLIMGDAICSFNPVYGQGMSVSALEAEALDDCLKEIAGRDRLQGLARNFFARATRAVDNAWSLAVGEDFRFPDVEGVKPAGTDLINWYVSKVHKGALHDREIARAFFQVMNMTHPPATIFRPGIALRIIKNSLAYRKPDPAQ